MMDTTQQKPAYSLAQLSQPNACETPYEFEVRDNEDKGTGFFLSVIGGEAPAVTEFVQRHLQGRRVKEALDKKADPRDKRVHVVPIEQDVKFSNELVAIHVVDWRGEAVAEAYSPENAIELCEANPWSIREQILAKAGDMSLFPLGRPKS